MNAEHTDALDMGRCEHCGACDCEPCDRNCPTESQCGECGAMPDLDEPHDWQCTRAAVERSEREGMSCE